MLETDWQIANDTVVRPDVMVICQDIDEKVLVTPDLIIEVVSSTSVKRDEIIKRDLYQREGPPYYILVYPENRLAKVYRNDAQGFIKKGDYSDEKAEFTIHDYSFNIDLAAIWR
ncbi:Uma2 family endonuclease [Methylotuvimicrobium sp. KM1]|uniref:Uma2 family endonuclease n=1 Tax=Methylotuvimicrobium sp. KM1 TaxID=3377707 RepID=UPI00384B121E